MENMRPHINKLLAVLLLLTFPACASVRSIGNNETYLLEPAECDALGIVKRDGVCYQRVIVGAKDDGHVIITKPDGTVYDVDNSGRPSFSHDLASMVQAIAIQKAMKD